MTIASSNRALAADILNEHSSTGTHTDITATSITVSGAGTFGSFTTANFSVGDITVSGDLTLVNAIDEFSTDGTLAGDSDTAVPTEQAVKTYVDAQIGGVNEFVELTDCPADYTGHGGKLVRVNATPDGLEFVDGGTLYAPLSHVTADGSSHTFIDQSVVSGATPTFTGTNFSGIPYTALSNGTDGELITWDAAGAIATVAAGTATHVLTSNGAGAAPTFQAPGAGTDVNVAIDAGASAGYLGAAAGDGVLRTSTGLTYVDGGDFVTISVTDNYLLNTGDVGTGVYDFGGATSFELPNGAGGTAVDADGEITVDTTSRTVNFYDGTTEAVIQPIMSKSVTAETPTDSEDISLFYVDDAVTITKIVAVLVGSDTPSVTWTVRHGTDRSAAGAEAVTGGTTTTSVSTGSVVTAFNDATVVADSFLWLETTAQSGTVTSINVTVFYRQDA